MLEMLGVLAIVGVLSVGGIAGYSKAIEKFKVNKLLGEYNNLIMGLLEHRDSIINNMPGGMYLGNFVSSANIAPANWKLKGIYLEDSFGNSVYPYVEEYADTNGDKKRVVVIVYFNGQTAKGSTDVFSEDLCAEMFSNLIIPLKSFVQRGYVWKSRHNSKDTLYLGDKFCTNDSKCLRNMTLNDVHAVCNDCDKEHENCQIIINF